MQVSQAEVKNFFESACGGEVGTVLKHDCVLIGCIKLYDSWHCFEFTGYSLEAFG